MPPIDLHTHTTWSDGSFSPKELVAWAHHHSVKTLALTDHDTTAGLDDAFEAGKALSLEIIAGIEISTQFHERECHILGYFIDHHDMIFQKRLERLQQSRVERIKETLAQLSKCGIDLAFTEIEMLAGKGSIGRPHIAQALIQHGHVSSFKQAFEVFLGSNGKAYIPRHVPEPEEVCTWIREAGGIAVLAHPFWEGFRTEEREKACHTLIGKGLQGLEVFYGSFSAKQISINLHLAKRFNLLMTGGSDFHGTFKPEILIGKGKGSLKVPPSLLDKLRTAAGR